MAADYRICSPYPHAAQDPDDGASSQESAIDERVDNVRVMPMAGGDTLRAAVELHKLWGNGRTLRVRFLDGVEEVQARVQRIAKEWEQLANLTLEFVEAGPADIRISFAEKGFSWSTVGTDARTVPQQRATMNFGWLEPDTSDREYERVVRHEFGHALGMIHEHQNPDAVGKIPWDKPKVYAYYARQDWSQADVDSNIFSVYDRDTTNFSTFDPESIMQYAVPDELTIGSFAIGWNTTFSDTDVAFMRKQYPRGVAGDTVLAIDAPPVTADLSTAGEVDTYRFDVATAGRYIVSTQGATDTVMALHGPNDPGALLAWDDDRGRGTNARIARRLVPGHYWLTVRHKRPTSTGTYAIGIKRR